MLLGKVAVFRRTGANALSKSNTEMPSRPSLPRAVPHTGTKKGQDAPTAAEQQAGLGAVRAASTLSPTTCGWLSMGCPDRP